MTERLQVQIPAGAAGEFSSPGSTFCADSHFGIRSTPMFKNMLLKASHSCRITCKHSESAREWRTALYKSNRRQQKSAILFYLLCHLSLTQTMDLDNLHSSPTIIFGSAYNAVTDPWQMEINRFWTPCHTRLETALQIMNGIKAISRTAVWSIVSLPK